MFVKGTTAVESNKKSFPPGIKFYQNGSFLPKQCHKYKIWTVTINVYGAENSREMALDNLKFINNNVIKFHELLP